MEKSMEKQDLSIDSCDKVETHGLGTYQECAEPMGFDFVARVYAQVLFLHAFLHWLSRLGIDPSTCSGETV
jgi:hypothetical protein